MFCSFCVCPLRQLAAYLFFSGVFFFDLIVWSSGCFLLFFINLLLTRTSDKGEAKGIGVLFDFDFDFDLTFPFLGSMPLFNQTPICDCFAFVPFILLTWVGL